MNETTLPNAVVRRSYDASVARPPVCASPWSGGWIAHKILRPYNRLRHAFLHSVPSEPISKGLRHVCRIASTLTDIDEHLETMYVEGLLCRPRLIVELGVRGGTSTAVFDQVSEICGSTIISGDIADCSGVSPNPRWHFFRGDDVHLAEMFPQYCRTLGITPEVDLLFIDTSHYYDHTVEEIRAWFPLLSSRAKVMFHDTNLRNVGPRKDGCFQLGWDNERGVIRAIEEYLGTRIDERRHCVDVVAGWLLRHWPNCNGFTILDRIA